MVLSLKEFRSSLAYFLIQSPLLVRSLLGRTELVEEHKVSGERNWQC